MSENSRKFNIFTSLVIAVTFLITVAALTVFFITGKAGGREKVRLTEAERLAWPEGKVDVVVDTDAGAEIDDQYALSYLLASSEKLDCKAVYAAPFTDNVTTDPEQGMEKSYDEINKILSLCSRGDLLGSVRKGAKEYLPDEKTPVSSEAVSHLVSLSEGYDKAKPLYVVAIGALTDVASAILTDPGICDRIVVVWLGGHSKEWENTAEFNLRNDVAAAKVVFSSPVMLVQAPCNGVASGFYVTVGDVKPVLGANALCDYVAGETITRLGGEDSEKKRVLWDVTAVAWLSGGAEYCESALVRAPKIGDSLTYEDDENGKIMRYIGAVYREALLDDLITKLKSYD